MDNNHLDIESVNKFESMLKTNSLLFFDSNEFEEITMYYIDMGNISLAKKANDLSLSQYPDSVSLNLITTEILLLENDLKRAYCVVTYNSLSAVEAVVRGIPVIATNNMSMVWPIAHKDFSQIEALNYNIDLQDWQNKIAYTMWNREEVKGGETWAHLKPVYF